MHTKAKAIILQIVLQVTRMSAPLYRKAGSPNMLVVSDSELEVEICGSSVHAQSKIPEINLNISLIQ